MMKFKVGDRVIVKDFGGIIFRVIQLDYKCSAQRYIVQPEGSKSWELVTTKSDLTKIEDMKKQANLTLETAKEFYKQGGAARKFALDNYSKDELTQPDWPESWEDLKHIVGRIVGVSARIGSPVSGATVETNKCIAPTKEDCESMLAYAQLRQLAKEMNDGWEPDWEDGSHIKYTVGYVSGVNPLHRLKIDSNVHRKQLICFKTKEMAEFSLKHHKELWEQYYQINP